jgi:hypothetical protein
MTGFVYFIAPDAILHRNDGDALVKIGYTRHSPHQRLRALQTGSPVHIKVWAYIRGTEALERAFHDAFAELRSHGEWFFVHYKLYDFLALLGREPHIGKLIENEQVEVALFDSVFQKSVPHPSVPEADYMRSARPEALRPFYPRLWNEVHA